MASSVVLQGAECRLYVGGKLYESVQSISWTIDYGEEPIYGIDSPMAQEITPTKVSVQGNVTGLRIKMTGGLQGYGLRARINEILHAPYVSLRIQDRRSAVNILWLPQMKVTSESIQISAKGTVKLNFAFKGIIPYNELDLNFT